jgi:predicted aspartyl protease
MRAPRPDVAAFRVLPLLWIVVLALATPHAGAEVPAGAVLATLPFLASHPPRRIVIDLAPSENARRMPLWVDTGAAVSLVSPRLAREMGLRSGDVHRRATVTGDEIRIQVGSRAGFEYGVLGGDFLARYVVELDFAKRRVRFLDPERYEVPASVAADGEAVLPLKIAVARPALRARLDGEPFDLLVDTGAQTGVLLSGAVAARAGIASAAVPDYRGAGFAGPIELEVGDAQRLELGPFRFARVPVVVAPRGVHHQGFPGDSILGYDVLVQFAAVRIDYPRKRIWLKRDPDAQPIRDPRLQEPPARP